MTWALFVLLELTFCITIFVPRRIHILCIIFKIRTLRSSSSYIWRSVFHSQVELICITASYQLEGRFVLIELTWPRHFLLKCL